MIKLVSIVTTEGGGDPAQFLLTLQMKTCLSSLILFYIVFRVVTGHTQHTADPPSRHPQHPQPNPAGSTAH